MRYLVSILLAMMLVLSPLPADAATVECHVVSNNHVVCRAAGVVVLDTRINVPTPAPVRITVTVPGPRATRTVTVRPAPVTNNVPGSTTTVNVPGPQKTVTASPKVAPSPHPTPNSSVSPTGQSGLVHGRVRHKQPDGFQIPPLTLKSVVQTSVSLLLLMGLILLALYAGYALGYRDRGAKEVGFLKSLRDQMILRK